MLSSHYKTNLLAEIARYESLVAHANEHGTAGNIWDNNHRLVLAKAEGYRQAETEFAPMVKRLQRIAKELAHSDGTEYFLENGEATTQQLWAVEQIENALEKV